MTVRGVILDVDGTVLRGPEAIPGAAEALAALSDRGLRRLFVSNNPTKRPTAYVDRFAAAGLDVAAHEVLTAGSVTAHYLAETHPGDRVYLIGEPGLRDLLDASGVNVVNRVPSTGRRSKRSDGGDPLRDGGDGAPERASADEVDMVVVSLDRDFGYETLVTGLRLLADEDVGFIGTDPDMVIPAADGNRPGSGAIIHAVSGVAGRDPDRVLGKPSDEAREMALAALDLPAEECLVVGDRLDTDVALGARAGMRTALMKTGVTDERTLARSSIEPDHVLDSIGDLPALLDDHCG